jgi:ketosteroid isomerase-like protein
LIESWKSVLGKVRTRHQLGPISVKRSGETAIATCQVRGLHQVEGAPGGPEWEVLGHYVFELSKRAGGVWKLDRVTEWYERTP